MVSRYAVMRGAAHGAPGPSAVGSCGLYWGGYPRPSLHRQEDPMGQMKEVAGVYCREGALDPKAMQLAAMAAAGCTS